MTTLKPTVVKKSISLSIVVAEWADNLAAKKGFGSNYSAYIADLIRRDREKDEELQMIQASSETSPHKINKAADQIVDIIQEAARQKTATTRRK
jgi:hypothetical protein